MGGPRRQTKEQSIKTVLGLILAARGDSAVLQGMIKALADEKPTLAIALQAFTLYWGLSDGEPLTYTEVGKLLGMGKGEVGTLQEQALWELKQRKPVI